MNDDYENVKKQKNLVELIREEELDSYSIEELKIRKNTLEQEVNRVTNKIASSKAHRSTAENLFK